jgi:hypothetical protein
MSSNRRVLVIHPDAQRRQDLALALGGLEVQEAANRKDAATWMNDELSLVVSHHHDFKKLLRDLDRRAPSAVRAVLCPHDEVTRAGLIEVAAQGYDFLTVDEGATGALRELASPRRTSRLAPVGDFTASFHKAGRAFSGAVLEVSSDGFSVRLEPGAPSELLAVGALVEGCSLAGPRGVVLQHPTAQVRSRDGARVGLEFLRVTEPVSGAFAASHPIQIVGAIRRAVRRGEAFSLSLVDGARTWPCVGAHVDAARNRVTFAGRVGPGVGTPVRLSFERAGRVFQGTTVVLEQTHACTTIALPSSLVQRNRRRSLRVTPPVHAPVWLQLQCPLTGRPARHALTDLQPSGGAFVFDDTAQLYPPGLRFSTAHLELAGQQHTVALAVQGGSVVSAEHGAQVLRRTGVRFSQLSPQTAQALSDALVTLRLPEVTCAGASRFREVWDLVGAAGASFPDYQPDAPGVPEPLERAHELVGDGRHGLAKSFVWRSDGQLVGHISGLRVYSGTWLSQHLAVRPGYTRGVAVSQALVGLMVDHGEALEDVRWVRGVWQRTNRWTSRIYGAIAGQLARTGRIARSSFELCQRTSAAPLEGTAGARAASAADLEALLETLRVNGNEVWLQSNDLVPGGLGLASLGARYAASGLHRDRTVGAVGPSSAPRGWVLLEDMSAGLCWAELFRSFSFVLADPGAPTADEDRAALLGWAHAQADARGWPVVRARVDAADAAWLLRRGYTSLGGVEELTVHRTLLREWNELLLGTFERASSLPREEHAP